MNDYMSKIHGPKANQLMGGAKRNTRSNTVLNKVEDTGMIEYCDNTNFTKFLKSFYLYQRVAQSYSSAVYVIPTTKKLDAMIKEFNNKLSEKGLTPKSAEAKKFANTEDLPYKRCMFIVFPYDSDDRYKLDNSKMVDFGIARRVNLLSEVYWFKYIDPETIEIHNSNPRGKSEHTVAKLTVQGSSGTFVFEGDLPEAKEFYDKPIVKRLNGGCDVETMCEYIDNGDTQQEGALNFISAVSCMKKTNKEICQQYISGDLVNSAFNVLFACEDKSSDEFNLSGGNVDNFNESDMESAANELLDNQELTNQTYDKSEYVTKFRNMYELVAKKNLSPAESTKLYKNKLKNLYKNLGTSVLKADIATALSRNGYSMKDSYEIANNIDENNGLEQFTDISKLEFIGDELYYTSKFNSIINSALVSAPLISLNARTYHPSISKRKCKRTKAKKRTTKKVVKKLEDEVEEPINVGEPNEKVEEQIEEQIETQQVEDLQPVEKKKEVQEEDDEEDELYENYF